MPEYEFRCDKCDHTFSRVWHIVDYDRKIKNVKCPECKTTKVCRDYSETSVTVNYIKGLHECTTVGEYADKQTKLYGEEKCAKMRDDFVTKKKDYSGKLQDGQTLAREDGEISKVLNKKQAKAKRKRKTKK